MPRSPEQMPMPEEKPAKEKIELDLGPKYEEEDLPELTLKELRHKREQVCRNLKGVGNMQRELIREANKVGDMAIYETEIDLTLRHLKGKEGKEGVYNKLVELQGKIESLNERRKELERELDKIDKMIIERRLSE